MNITETEFITLTGQAATAELGTLTHEMSYTLTGVSAIASVGSLTTHVSITEILTGQEATAEVGYASALGYKEIDIT